MTPLERAARFRKRRASLLLPAALAFAVLAAPGSSAPQVNRLLPAPSTSSDAPEGTTPSGSAAGTAAEAAARPVDDLAGLEVGLQLETLFQGIAERAAPSIVSIAAYVRDGDEAPGDRESPVGWVTDLEPEYPGFRRVGSGSGVVLDGEGHILTNRHYLLRESGDPVDLLDIETVDGRHTIGSIVGLEPTLNLGIVRLTVYSERQPPEFAPIPMGDSFGLTPGRMVVAMGDPFGPDRFYTFGLLAGTPNRECYQEQLTATYLQVAAQLHPGAFGGALLNLRGELIGMLTPRDPSREALRDPRPVGVEFALPSNIVQAITRAILKNGSTRSPWLGYAVMGPAELRAELGTEAYGQLARPRVGIYIENVFDPSPAHAAGVRRGDFLVRFDGHYIGSPLDFQRQLYLAGIGAEVELEFFREGESLTRRLRIEERPPEATTR